MNEYIRLCSIPAVQEKFRERMDIEEDNLCFCGLSKENHRFIEDHNYAGSQTPNICIPLPIDPQNPERGLWGMVDWTKFTVDGVYTGSRDMCIRHRYSEIILCVTQPSLALLRALMAQWGIEEEKE